MEDSVREGLLDQEVVQGIRTAFESDGPAAFASLITEFLEASEVSIRSIEVAVSEQDWGTAGQVAHRLKGMSSQLGALALRDASRGLEEALNDNPDVCMLNRVSGMKITLQQTVEAYDKLISDLELR